MTAPARYATAPDPGAAHETEAVALMARILGTPLMAWQEQVARVATERSADGRGWRYPTVVLTVPRQSGKTTLMRAIMAQRTLRYPGSQAFYTAQSGKDARERWGDLVSAAESKIPHLVKVRRGAGAECLQWKNGGGQVRSFAPTRTALHGYTPQTVMLDEVFAYDEDLGEALLAAIIPAQATLPDRQLWIVSTAGDADSTWLYRWVERGREATQDPLASIAYFEWSAEPGLDLSRAESFAEFHPAVGYTQEPATLLQARETMTLGEFDRAFGNRWQSTRSQLISDEIIASTINPSQPSVVDPARLVFAYDAALDRSWASIWAAWADDDGAVHVRPYLSRVGIWWLPEAIKTAQMEHPGVTIAADDGGATRTITSRLELDGVEVRKLRAGEFATATGDFIDALRNGRVDHPGTPALVEALTGLALRKIGESEAISRRDSTGPVWDVIAATVAHRIATHSQAYAQPMVVA